MKENEILRNQIDELRQVKRKNSYIIEQLQIKDKEISKQLKYISDENANAYEQR